MIIFFYSSKPAKEDSRPLRPDNEVAKGEHRPLRSDKEAAKGECRPLRLDNEAAKSQCKLLRPDNEAAEGECRPLRPDNEAAKGESRPLRPDSEVAKDEYRPLRPHNEAAKGECRPLRPDNEAAKGECRPLRPDNEAAKGEYRPIRPDNEGAKGECRPHRPDNEAAKGECRPLRPDNEAWGLNNEKCGPDKETRGSDNETCHAENPTPYQDHGENMEQSRTVTLDVSGGGGGGSAGDLNRLLPGRSPGPAEHVLGGSEATEAPDVPKSWAPAMGQEPEQNGHELETHESDPSEKSPPGKTAVLTRRVSMGHEDSDSSTMIVTFKALLSSELMIPSTKLGILFGEPLSDWQELLVEMSKEAVRIEDPKYRLVVGYLTFPQELVGRAIPYKYVAFKHVTVIKHEYLHAFSSANANRCLIVPGVEAGFTKYDDVILCEDPVDKRERLRRGRYAATLWMLPRPPPELDYPQFDFAAALATFEAVVSAHGPDGTRVCVGDQLYTCTVDHLFKVTAPVNEYVGSLIRNLREYMTNRSSRDGGTLLRSTIYICLILASTRCSFQLLAADSLLIFEAFLAFADQLEQDSTLVPSIVGGEVRPEVCAALRQLVKKFVSQPAANAVNAHQQGNWIAVIPFIHRWDLAVVRDWDWLDLTDWKLQRVR